MGVAGLIRFRIAIGLARHINNIRWTESIMHHLRFIIIFKGFGVLYSVGFRVIFISESAGVMVKGHA